MKQIIVFVCLLLVIGGCSKVGIPLRPEKLGSAEIEFNLPSPERWELPNGLVVHFVHDDEVPLIRGSLLLYGGSIFDPADRAGLARLTGALMRDGSIRGVSPDAFDDQLDRLSASIESSFSDEYGTVKFSSLSSDFSEVFKLFARVVREPAFDRSRFALAKKLALEGIARRKDDPTAMAELSFFQLVYGADSPYGRVTTEKSVGRITERDLRRFHRQFVRPIKAHLIIAGDIDKAQLAEAIEKEFGDWGAGETDELPTFPPVEAGAKPGIYVLERDFQQASIIVGHQGPPRQSNDQFAMSIFNRYFGYGGFGTLLLSEVRTKLGLAYSIFGGFSPGPIAGVYEIDLQTRNEEGIRALNKVFELVESTMHEEPSSADLREAKLGAERSFVFRFDSPDAIATRQALLELWGYPKDYDKLYLNHIEAVTAEAVTAVPARWVHPNELVTVVVGGIRAQALADSFADKRAVYKLAFDTEPTVVGPVLPSE